MMQSKLEKVPTTFINSVESEDLKRRLLWHGIFLCTIGFIAGLFIPLYVNPRAGLATHLLGITEGLFLAVVGLCYPQLKLSFGIAKANFWMLIISAYVGFVGELLGAIFGLTRIFIITAKGLPEANALMETIVEISIKGISVLLILSCFITLFGLSHKQKNSDF